MFSGLVGSALVSPVTRVPNTSSLHRHVRIETERCIYTRMLVPWSRPQNALSLVTLWSRQYRFRHCLSIKGYLPAHCAAGCRRETLGCSERRVWFFYRKRRRRTFRSACIMPSNSRSDTLRCCLSTARASAARILRPAST